MLGETIAELPKNQVIAAMVITYAVADSIYDVIFLQSTPEWVLLSSSVMALWQLGQSKKSLPKGECMIHCKQEPISSYSLLAQRSAI